MILEGKHQLHALCPYFAMFPHTFVRRHVAAFTDPTDTVLDPFSGRGTTLLESLLLDRSAVAIDINPVAACVTGAKARVPRLSLIDERLTEILESYRQVDYKELDEERRALPPFFRRGFHFRTLREILFLRRVLDWRRNYVDQFIAALALGSLHGEMATSPSYFSNQMPRTISTKPGYSVRYWQKNNLWPQRRRVFDILASRAKFRLRHGTPHRVGLSLQADVRQASGQLEHLRGQIRAVITSPPYLNVTNFEEDQWLRLWFLGGLPKPTYSRISKDDRYLRAEAYWQFLSDAWKGIATLVADDAVIVCRIGGKKLDVSALGQGLSETLRAVFPEAHMVMAPIASTPSQRQTNNFRPGTPAFGLDADFVFRV